MMRSMYAAISGLRVHQTMLDITANNIANVNTVGYKGERITFKDALSQMLHSAGAAVTGGLGGQNAEQVGLGVQIGSIDNQMGAGGIQSTGNPFDLAVQGDGWFQVSSDPTSSTAPIYYTRAGNFQRDANGDLVTPEGYYLVGKGGVKINVPADAKSVAIDAKGTVSVVNADASTTSYTIQLAKFPNEGGLERVGGNRWAAGVNAGTPAVNDAQTPGYGGIASGMLEMSNVDLSQEFTNMITAQRGFQANSRVISSADDMLQELVNLKR
jgi:flagellar hook protein FlgE